MKTWKFYLILTLMFALGVISGHLPDDNKLPAQAQASPSSNYAD